MKILATMKIKIFKYDIFDKIGDTIEKKVWKEFNIDNCNIGDKIDLILVDHAIVNYVGITNNTVLAVCDSYWETIKYTTSISIEEYTKDILREFKNNNWMEY
jgi:hypothetical protein